MIADFLNKFRPGGPWLLVAIHPTKKGSPDGVTFTDAIKAEAWAKEKSQTHNLYFSINPTREPINKKAEKTDISHLEWLWVDCDCRAGEDFEQERQRIKSQLNGSMPKDIPAPSLVIDSGGGYWGLWRLSEPLEIPAQTDASHKPWEKAEAFNVELANRLGGDHCFNIDRIARLPGTVNWPDEKKRKKGREPCEAKVYSWNDAAYPLTAFKAAPPKVEASTSGSRSASRKALPRPDVGDSTASLPDWKAGTVEPFGTEELRQWAKVNGKWYEPKDNERPPRGMLGEYVLVLIATGQHPLDENKYPSRSEPQFKVSCDLVRAGVPDEIHYRILTTQGSAVAASVLEKSDFHGYALKQIRDAHTKVAEDPPVLHPAAPLESAREFMAREHPDLLHYNGDWLAYNGAAYAEMEDGTMRSALYMFLERALLPLSDEDVEKGKIINPPFNPTQAKVSNVLDALKGVTHRPRDTFTPPCWLEGDGLPARELVACRNGLLHLPTGELLHHTPRFFTRNALTFDYDAHAPTPTGWLEFLDSLWPEEPEAIALLQEVFGYVLIPDTSQQKIFLMVGPTRSGKGTIARVLTELVGPANICAPSLADFGETFGLESLLGKQLAILSDVRLDGKANHAAIAEALLRISGEDAVNVKRKHKTAWDGRLAARFLLLSNVMPRLSDVSPALANRFVPLLMDQSFLGREDHDLINKLLPELPGILNWAIDGWRRLRERGRFALPQSSRDAIQQLIELAAPVATFLRERCELDPDAEVLKEELYATWKAWCDENSTHPGAPNTFAAQLYAATSARVRSKKSRKGDGRVMVYAGLSLKNKPPF